MKTSVEARSTTSAARRQARKDLARLEQQIARLDERLAALHEQMVAAASNYERLTELQREVDQLRPSRSSSSGLAGGGRARWLGRPRMIGRVSPASCGVNAPMLPPRLHWFMTAL